MFAIPDWSVSPDNLKSEAPAPSTIPSSVTAQKKQKPKKQKASGSIDVVPHEDVSGLWAKVVEGKDAQGLEPKSHENKDGKARRNPHSEKEFTGHKRKREESMADATPPTGDPTTDPVGEPENTSTDPDGDAPAHKKRRRRGKSSSQNDDTGIRDHSLDTVPPESSTTPRQRKQSQAPPEASKPAPMTPLQMDMRDKLISARFRHLNEALYTKPSAEASRMFDESPEMFSEYHEGFRRQVQVWPENPIDGYIAAIRDRSQRKAPPPSRSGAAHPASSSPLPRTNGVCTIADLGCGDARLAQALVPDQKRLRVQVLSFDLQEHNAMVTKADISALPLNSGSVDVAIFCLALMGTNWTDFIEEAFRVLRWKGELWIAEIKSRFGRVETKGKRHGGQGGEPVEHSVGKRRKAAVNRNTDDSLGRLEDTDLATEIDIADHHQNTNMSAFIEALGKRGFVPHSDRESAIDTSNKMFVRLHFTKIAEPIKGKGTRTSLEPRKIKFLPHDNDECDESTILKPCVYKLR